MTDPASGVPLASLLSALPSARVHGPTTARIRAIVTDSRRVAPGALFVAYSGVSIDSHRFVPDAIRRGAVAVVVEREIDTPSSVARIAVSSGRAAWALLSAAWHGFPSRKLTVVGVTGTDGKTTTSSLIGSILDAAGRRVGLVTTVAARIDGEALDTGFHTTTPEPPELQGYLADMLVRGTDVAVVETTSHALALDKVIGVDYDVAVITNVTHEHLDFHGTWDNYLEAKARLFEGLMQSYRKADVPKAAILNAEDASFGRLHAIAADRRLTYALDVAADLRPIDLTLTPTGTRFVARTPIGDLRIDTPLLGRFNVANSLAAIGAAIALDLPPDAITTGLSRVQGVPGRLEPIVGGQPFGVIVDFAHTPNSLRRVLELGRTMTAGRLLVVFGCAGQRDVAKRPLMGRAAGELADGVYLTAEDPRAEDLAQINAQIAAGVRQAGLEPTIVPDRGEAIERALRDARPGDLVLITGKGHEQSMCIGEEELPWDDRRAAASALERLGHSP